MTAQWIKKLPPGEYDIKKLKEFSGLNTHGSLKKVMLNHGAKVKRIEYKNKNFSKDIFIWDGFKEVDKK